MSATEIFHHRRLSCGAEFAAVELPGRHTTSFQLRFLTGMVDEPVDKLGLARITEETIAKGTEKRTAQELSDAFDAIGAQAGSGVGRETIVFRCNCLPEFTGEALALHAEMLRTPTFPQEFCDVAIELGLQELKAIEDDPSELASRMIAPHAFGDLLGRHELGNAETLGKIDRTAILEFWKRNFSTRRMQVTVGGKVDVARFADEVDRLFSGFGKDAAAGQGDLTVKFTPGVHHHMKEAEQQQILMCWPGVAVTDKDYAVERVMLSVLGGGMSSRLFTEVREKQGLVYWVGAWDDHPKGSGMIFLGASTTPVRCDLTISTLLREVDRLSEDLTAEELNRAKVGIIAKTQTHGDITRARLGELSGDLFHFGRPVGTDEKNARVEAVTIGDIKRYLSEHPRDRRCVQTLGPRAMEGVTK
ncbi:MAG: insulinase family protein [Planctomycetes bacterium]|nr:insulinase family protein [Planctomycetota bacterium]